MNEGELDGYIKNRIGNTSLNFTKFNKIQLQKGMEYKITPRKVFGKIPANFYDQHFDDDFLKFESFKPSEHKRKDFKFEEWN